MISAIVEDYAAWSSEDDWDAVPEVSHLPSRSRRRLSQLTRMVLDVGHRLCAANPIDDVVFASRHGELNRQLEITDGILQAGEVSPSSFGYSVFNTPVALLSLHEGLKGRTRALYDGGGSLVLGLVQAVISLGRSSSGRVLFLYGDERIPETYMPVQKDLQPPAALGLVLRLGNEKDASGIARLSVDSYSGDAETGVGNEQAELAQWMENGKNELEWFAPGSKLSFRKILR